MFEIQFLGTSASAPTAHRSLSSAVVMFDAERFLIDCGEGTQRQILRSGIGFRRLDKVLLTHRHLDHILGLGGLASTFGRWEAMESMEIWGSPDTLSRVRNLMKVVFHPGWEPDERIGLVPMKPGLIFENKKVTVEAFAVEHRRTPCFGFLFEEKPRRRFLQEQADALGVPFGPQRAELVRGNPITLESGQIVQPAEVLGEPVAGAKLCFVSDVGRTGPLHQIAHGSDLLVIEGTYLDRDKQLARDFGHITVAAAAKLALKAEVKQLVLHHIGRRYGVREILAEAHRYFPRTIVVGDLDRVRIRDKAPLEWERWSQRRSRRPAQGSELGQLQSRAIGRQGTKGDHDRNGFRNHPQVHRNAKSPVSWQSLVIEMPDPRAARGKRHLLSDILCIAICACLDGVHTAGGIAEFGKEHQAWFQTWLTLPYGIPAHNTFNRVLQALDSQQLETLLARWMEGLVIPHPAAGGTEDSRTVRHFSDLGDVIPALHRVSTWATEQGLTLGQVAMEAESQEIKALPKLLQWLTLQGCIVTMDRESTQ